MAVRRSLVLGTGSLLLVACQAQPALMAPQSASAPAGHAAHATGGARQLQAFGLKLRLPGLNLC